MTYYYTALGPERFQQFCQALLVASFPDVQCLPVGQPDGGRDAVLYLSTRWAAARPSDKKNQVIFQVKYSRDPSKIDDVSSFLEQTVKSELKKIRKLRSMGARKYYLLTNLEGSSHLESGSIDKVNKWLSEKIGIEAHCWWKNDLDRRLDDSSDIKWSYPEILKATDLLQALLEGKLGENEQRRRDAIHAYMSAQYVDDEEVKFKQVELQSKLTSLFVDLPMQVASESFEAQSWTIHQTPLKYSSYYRRLHVDHAIKAADFFLTREIGSLVPRVVLEGAPGQGKSTITQYVCQVMRILLLGKHHEREKLPAPHRRAPVRIPFRVDLRDFSKWVSGKNPFLPRNPDLADDEVRSLEGFLAAQVRGQSGGHAFSVSDLAAVVRSSHVLLALDGFDEVAERELRNLLVEEISKGIKRLRSLGGYSISTIVTSRPAAFAKSEGFPQDEWRYFELMHLERPQVDEYTNKWMSARQLNVGEQLALREVLSAKLQEPHTQFLSRNPMQLTILLALVHQRGPSLPEKRTALYDTYMDLFFAREAEKSEIVKEYRDLLVDIHRFLAWKLQTSSEGGGTGSIEYEDLRRILLEYLFTQGEDTTIVADLFNGVIERVGALVSRVQGTYEFEVQPLREYFAARHLYETAPYSPAGLEKSGTKLDRFEALSRNPYWLNVARFYAGCFSKGEISALVDAIGELDRSSPYRHTSHSRSLALMLLADWVFTQYQPAVKRVVTLLTESPGVRLLLAGGERSGPSAWISLPERCGCDDFVNALAFRWKHERRPDEDDVIGTVIAKNLSATRRLSLWQRTFRDADATTKAAAFEALGLVRELGAGELLAAVVDVGDELLRPLICTWRFDVISQSGLEDAAEELILSGRFKVFVEGDRPSSPDYLSMLAEVFSAYRLAAVFGDDSSYTLRQALQYRGARRHDDRLPQANGAFPGVPKGTKRHKALTEYARLLDTSVLELSTSLEAWDSFIENGRAAWGDRSAFNQFAVIAAAVRSKSQLGLANSSLNDTGASLAGRVRYARLRSGAPKWWANQLASLNSETGGGLTLLTLWTWATVRTTLALKEVLQSTLDSLAEKDWHSLCFDFEKVAGAIGRILDPADLSEHDIESAGHLSPRLVVFLGKKVSRASRARLVNSHLKAYSGSDQIVAEFIVSAIIDGITDPSEWERGLEVLGSTPIAQAKRSIAARPLPPMDSDLARRVASEPDSFPLIAVAHADMVLSAAAGAEAISLQDISLSDGWFDVAN